MLEALLTKAAIAERAQALLPEYREIIARIPPEAGFGGIWESEMFLFYAATQPFAPKQILESGRARGKSTLILARCFADARIISIEYDRQSENAAAAEAKLKSELNVELLYGDTRAIPAQIRSGATEFLHACPGRCHFLTGKYEFDCFSRRGECF